MKKLITLIFAVLMLNTLAQAPQGMSHQAVIRNTHGELITAQTIGIRVSILKGSAEGTAVFVETHQPVSNENGLITYVIGSGTNVSGTFAEIDWADGPYFLKTEADPGGGTDYSISGTTQFLSVPYALFAEKSNDSYWEKKESDIYRLGGNVGIGLSTPEYKLDVDGAITSRISNAFRLRQNSYGVIFRNDNNSFWTLITDPDDPDGTFNTLRPLRIEFETGNVRLGNVLNIQHSGNVGIGTEAPTQKLDINGQIRIRGGNPGAGKVLTSNADGTASWQSESDPTVPQGTQTGQMQYWNGNAWVNVPPGSTGQVLTFIDGEPTWRGTGSGTNDVYNPTTGKIWMDRNLGATQVATSSTDANSYGHLYQWGRGTDGHQSRTSGTTTTLSSNYLPMHANFILAPNIPSDWCNPQNDDLWQGVSGTNNPCPAGYRLPTEAEWNAERMSWSTSNAAGAFASPLKLPVAGYRSDFNGSLRYGGIEGYYWSNTSIDIRSRYLVFGIGGAFMYSSYRANGFSVRCLKD